MNRQMAQEPSHLRGAHVAWMAFPMKEYVALNPIAVSCFGADGIMLKAHYFAHLVEEFELGVGNETIARP